MANIKKDTAKLKTHFEEDCGKVWPIFDDLIPRAQYMTGLMNRRLTVMTTHVMLDVKIANLRITKYGEVMPKLDAFSIMLDWELKSLNMEVEAHDDLRAKFVDNELEFFETRYLPVSNQLIPLMAVQWAQLNAGQKTQSLALNTQAKHLLLDRYPFYVQQRNQFVSRLCLREIQTNITFIRTAVDGFRDATKAPGHVFAGLPLALKTNIRTKTEIVRVSVNSYQMRTGHVFSIMKYMRMMNERERNRANQFKQAKARQWRAAQSLRALHIKQLGIAKGLGQMWETDRVDADFRAAQSRFD